MKTEIQFKPFRKMSESERESRLSELKVFDEIYKRKPSYMTTFEDKEEDKCQLTVTGSFNPSDIYCDITRNGFVITDTKFQFGTKFEDRIKTELQGEL